MSVQVIEGVVVDAEESFQLLDLLTGGGGTGSGSATDAGEHQVLRGVFAGDKLNDFGPVTSGFEVEGAEAVGDPFGHAFGHQAVFQNRGKWGRLTELGADCLVTARGDDNEFGPELDAAPNGVVGRSVAGVKGNQRVERG
jgi:hypothetical protein